jgi:hypothetical protein
MLRVTAWKMVHVILAGRCSWASELAGYDAVPVLRRIQALLAQRDRARLPVGTQLTLEL